MPIVPKSRRYSLRSAFLMVIETSALGSSRRCTVSKDIERNPGRFKPTQSLGTSMVFHHSGRASPKSAGLRDAGCSPRSIWDRFRGRKRDTSDCVQKKVDQQSQVGSVINNNLLAASLDVSSSFDLAPDNPPPTSLSEHGSDDRNAIDQGCDKTVALPDRHGETLLAHEPSGSDGTSVWSKAYDEAVEDLSGDVDVAILRGETVEWLFKQLQEVEKGANEDCLLRKGITYLRKLKVPLERFKLALDLTTPLANMEPIAGTVLGMVRSATALAISISTADEDFAKQIGEMLERITYIDDCDTLGQKTERTHIHAALVKVYRKLLEFYYVALDMLSRKGTKLLLKLVMQDQRLPDIIKEFLNHAGQLRDIVHNETLAIAQDIKIMLYDEQIGRWLDGGNKMRQRNQMHSNLQFLRADEACEWLFQDPHFLEWYRATTSQHLVILGNMGSGKTVSMNYLIDMIISRNQYQIPQPRICYHYCRNDETGNAVFIYSTLILALLEQLSGLKKSFFEWYKQIITSGSPEPATNPEKLEEFLRMYIGGLERELFIVVDGLDECDEVSRDRLVRLTRDLANRTKKIKILFASRPEEEILQKLDGMATIHIEPSPRRDAIIVQKTVDNRLPNLTADVKSIIVQSLSQLSQGSAIWIKMAVELICIKNIKARGPLKVLLKDMPLPTDLWKLFAALFSKYAKDDSENQRLTARALEILTVARRPLGITELAWAVAISEAPHNVRTVTALEEDFVDTARIMQFVHPFVSAVDFDEPHKHQVRLVHQSVKELIMRKSPLEWANSDPSTVSQEFTDQRIEILEANSLNMCLKYLLLDEIGQRDLFSGEQTGIIEMPQGDNLFSDSSETEEYDPTCTWETWEEDMLHYDVSESGLGELFVYASTQWVEHFSTITAQHLPELWKIEKICQKGSKQLENWTRQNCRPNCTFKAQWDFDATLFDPLVVSSLYGSESMLRNMLEKSKFENAIYLDDTFRKAANQLLTWFQFGDLSRIRLLFFARNASSQLRSFEFFREVLRHWTTGNKDRRGWDDVFDLVYEVIDRMVEEQWGNELFCIAARCGCLPVVQRLLQAARTRGDLEGQLFNWYRLEGDTSSSRALHQSIGEAVYENRVKMVEYLLAQGGLRGHLEYRNSYGENILHLASRFCNPAMFQILVPKFMEGVDQVDQDNNTVLARVISAPTLSPTQRYESARILLLVGRANADGFDKNDERLTPLRLAARRGHLAMCRLLIENGGVDPLSALKRGEHGEIVLKDEILENEENAAALLELLSQVGNTRL